MNMQWKQLYRLGAVVLMGVSLAGPSMAQRNALDNRYDISVYENGGYPDITVDPIRLKSQVQVLDRYFDVNDAGDQCVMNEGQIGAYGWRRIMVFDVVILNMGDGDLVVGRRDDPENPYYDTFYFDDCHGHYHIRNFSEYVVTGTGGVALGHKFGFCFEDSFKFSDNKSNGYSCNGIQGISSGWGDWYYKQLPGQWVDVTDLPPGDYKLRVAINLQTNKKGKAMPYYQGPENDGDGRYPDTIEIDVSIPKREEK